MRCLMQKRDEVRSRRSNGSGGGGINLSGLHQLDQNRLKANTNNTAARITSLRGYPFAKPPRFLTHNTFEITSCSSALFETQG